MGLSRISVYSPFIFINDLGDITDDPVTNLANDRGWKRYERSGRQDGLRWNLANGAAALHRLKFGIKGSKAFLRGRADQSCEMGNSELGRRVC